MSKRTPIAMLVFNQWERTLSALAEMRQYASQIVIVDNGSSEDRSGQIADLYPEMGYVRLPANAGWAGGYNSYLSSLDGGRTPFAYLINSDAVATPGSVEAAIDALRENSRAAAAGSVVLDADRRSGLVRWNI